MYRPAGLILSKTLFAYVILDKKMRERTVSDFVMQFVRADNFYETAKRGMLTKEYYDTDAALEWLEKNCRGIDIQQALQFSGDLRLIQPMLTEPDDLPEQISNQNIYWLEPSSEPSFFQAAYKDMEDLETSIAHPLRCIIPNTFPYTAYIRTIYGLYPN